MSSPPPLPGGSTPACSPPPTGRRFQLPWGMTSGPYAPPVLPQAKVLDTVSAAWAALPSHTPAVLWHTSSCHRMPLAQTCPSPPHSDPDHQGSGPSER